MACLLAAVGLLLVLVSGISTAAAILLGKELQRTKQAKQAEKEARSEALAKLWDSYLVQARAGRMSRQPGQRFGSLRAIGEAMKLPLPEGRSLDELRTEAIAALCLPDLEVGREWKLDLTGTTAFTIADTFERYAFADSRGNVSVRRLDDHCELCPLPGEGPLDWYDTLWFSPDGRFLVQRTRTAAGWPCRLWKLDGAKPVMVLAAPSSDWDFSPDSRRCAVFDHQGRLLRIHDPETGRELRRFQYEKQGGRLRWNPRRPLLAQCTPTGWRTINVETGEVVAEAAVPHCHQLAWHPEGRVLAASSDTTRQITIWDTQTRRLTLPPLEGHRNGGIVLRFNHAGDLLLSNDWNGLWRLWDVRTGKLLMTQPAAGDCLCFRADDGLVGADGSGGRVRLFRLRRGSEFRTVVRRPSAGTDGYSSGGVLDAKGRFLAVGTRQGVALVDVLRGEEGALLPLPGNLPLRFTARDGALWTYGRNGVLRWPIQPDPADRNKRRVGPPQRMASTTTGDWWGSSPDVNILAIPYYSRGALLWLRAANRTLALAPQQDVRYCAVSPDGRLVATGSHTHATAVGAKVWDARSGKHVADLVAGGGLVRFSPDSKWLLSSGVAPRIWRCGTWQEGATLGGPSANFGVFSPDSELLALSDTPGVVRLVRTATGKEVARLTAPEQTRLWPLGFTPDGSQLITVGIESEALHLFDLRLIRQQLAQLGLDWDAPPLPPAKDSRATPLAVELDMGNLLQTAQAEKLLSQAQQHLQAGQHAKALAALEQAIKIAPRHAEAHRVLARRLLVGPSESRDPKRALSLAGKAVELADGKHPLYFVYDRTLGMAVYRTGQHAAAVPILERSLKGSNSHSDAFDLFFLAMCHARLGNTDRAKECFKRAVQWWEKQKGLPASWADELKEIRAEAEAVLGLK